MAVFFVVQGGEGINTVEPIRDAFINWYDKRSDGTGKSYYYLPKCSNVKPFISRKEYIKFDSIESFEIKSYKE